MSIMGRRSQITKVGQEKGVGTAGQLLVLVSSGQLRSDLQTLSLDLPASSACPELIRRPRDDSATSVHSH